jgi:2-methylcitrate dehydratase PrpD
MDAHSIQYVPDETATITHRLADFASEARYSDIPEDVADYTKLLLLDTIICGIAAGDMQRSKIMHRVLESMGGHPDATVFGTAQRYPAPLAAMVNAEIMNYLDADEAFFTSSHFAAFNAAAALAEGQRAGASGKEMIAAMAVGFDVNARLNLASVVLRATPSGGFEWARVQGMGFASFGTAASSGMLKKLDREQMRNAFGLVTSMAPTPMTNTMPDRLNHFTMKYANYQGVALAGMQAAILAENGYEAEQTSLDSGHFLMAQGCVDFDSDLLSQEIGSKWWIMETSIKFYPSCRYTHGPIDMMLRLMKDENISVGDIEKVVIYMNPLGYALKQFREPRKEIADDPCAPLNGAFNIPYVIALAALGRKAGPGWYSTETLDDKEVWALANRITTQVDEAAKDETRNALKEKIRRFRETPSSLSITAKGQTFHLKSKYAAGDPWNEQTRANWAQVSKKFHDFCGHQISAGKIDRIISQFRALEDIENIDREIDLNYDLV